MNGNIFQDVKTALQNRLPDVVAELLPGGRSVGREYVCGSLEGGAGDSCRTSLENGVGSDFATGETWPDIIGLAGRVWHASPIEAARGLARRYGISTDHQLQTLRPHSVPFAVLLPVPDSAPEPPNRHPQYGQCSRLWRYQDARGRILACTARFDLPTGKVVLPLCYGRNGEGRPYWTWKALPEPRPLYGLDRLAAMPDAPALLVEGEKTADAAQALLPRYAVLTWSGGAHAVGKADWQPLQGRTVVIWPDKDMPGFQAALDVAAALEKCAERVSLVLPPVCLPDKWDLADTLPPDVHVQEVLDNAVSAQAFRNAMLRRPQECVQGASPPEAAPETEEFALQNWPRFASEACPGLLGEFVRLATRDSEADPAAVCITALVRFCAEVYGVAPHQGPHLYVGETVHPPRLFAVICGNSSKARKGTSRYPVTRLFGRECCEPDELRAWKLPLPARESGGPLSTGEGLAHYVRDETDEERERRQRQNPNEPVREKGDKRLMILDEEFASGLACTKREGNTLSMGIRCFWDSGEYAPLTKSNPVTVCGAHINIITHITMQELAVCLGDVQVVNGFGNRFLWICARRSKLVPMPSRMPKAELASLQRELWYRVGVAQKRGIMVLNAAALELWKKMYADLSQEHSGLVGSILNRAEAQTLRLALAYALLDGQGEIAEAHLRAAFAMWRYAQASALYVFGERSTDPLEARILGILKQGPLSASELSAALNRNVPRERLQPMLQQLEAQRRISIEKQKGSGRPRQIISLGKSCMQNEIDENTEKRRCAE